METLNLMIKDVMSWKSASKDSKAMDMRRIKQKFFFLHLAGPWIDVISELKRD